MGVQIISTAVLARMLTPRDFGLVTMVTTFSLLLLNFGLNGLTHAVLQRENLNHALASNLFWVCSGAGFLLTIAFASAGSLLARFYHDPAVAHIAIGVSPSIFITSISVMHFALLQRAMRFSIFAANDLVARSVGIGVSILLAWAGWGYWALVAGVIANPASAAVGAWVLCRWMPGSPRRNGGTGAMLSFAMHSYGRFFFNYFSRNTDNLLVGWRFNAAALGFYKKAYDLFALSAGQIVSLLTPVAVSALSRFSRESDQYKRFVLRAVGVMAFVGMGVGADLTLVGKDVIRVLLGSRWDTAGRLFTMFGPGIGIMWVYGMHGWIHLSSGRADRWLRWGVVEFIVTVVLFLGGLPWGPAGVAVAWSVSFWVLTVPAFWYAGRPIGFGVLPLISAVWRYAIAALVAAGLSAAILHSYPCFAAAPGVAPAVFRMLAISVLVGILYLGSVIILHGGFGPLRQLASLIAETLSARKIAQDASAAASHIP